MAAIEIEPLLPLACAWLREHEALILDTGVELNARETQIARLIGVQYPARIRLLQVLAMPEPKHPILRAAMQQSGFFTGNSAGLTLNYGILVREGWWRDEALIAHELVHVAQYERLGSCEAFLREYLSQCLEIGYLAAPLEIEAREVSAQVLAQTT